MTTSIINPGTGGGATAPDGYVRYFVASDTWANIHDAASGNFVSYSGPTSYVRIISDNLSNKWRGIWRSFLSFDISSLPNVKISSATIKVWVVQWKNDEDPTIQPTLNIFAANPTDNVSLEVADYSRVSAAPFSTKITRGHLTALTSSQDGSYQSFALNAAGLQAITANLIDDGIAKFCIRDEDYDAENTPPSWIASYDHECQIGGMGDVEAHWPSITIDYGLPSNALSRVTGIRHVYRANALPQDTYNIILVIGGISLYSNYVKRLKLGPLGEWTPPVDIPELPEGMP